MIADPFFQISMLIVVTTVVGLIASWLRQPLIPAYIVAGILLGPAFGLVTDTTLIDMLSLWGVAFFLFLIGLEMNMKKLADVGTIATIGGTLQVTLTFALSFFVLNLWLGAREALYLSIVVALSSTMVVVKLLSDRKEIDTLHARIAVGILIMQDILAIIALSVFSTFNGNGGTLPFILLTVGLLLLAAFLLSRYLFPVLFKFAARSSQLLFLLSISTCLIFSLAFHYLGLSIAIGAFLAGISLASLPYTLEIIGRIKPLRDFFSTLFFTSLGLSLSLVSVSGTLPLLLTLLLLTVILKPLLIMVLCSFFGYVKRTAFLVGVSLAQISEFSLILAAVGLSLGHLSQQLYTVTIILAMLTIALTSYTVSFELSLYSFLKRFLGFLEWNSADKPLQYLPQSNPEADVVLVGYDRIGYSVLRALQKMKKHFMVIDFNPDIIRDLIAKRIPCLYGDIADPEILERVNLHKATMLLSTVVSTADNLYLLKLARARNPHLTIFVSANTVDDALQLYRAGADYVILPHFLGGEYASVLLEQLSDAKSIVKRKLDHLTELRTRMQLGHEHPHHHA